MRTADRVLAGQWNDVVAAEAFNSSPEFRATLARGIGESVVIVADNVARYVHDRNDALSFDNFPTLAPPWPMFWTEYPSSSGRERRGVFVIDATDVVRDPDFDPDDGPLAEWAWAAVKDAEGNGVPFDEVRWVFTMLLFIDANRNIWGPAGSMSLALDEHGKVVGNGWSLVPTEHALDGIAEKVRDTIAAEVPDVDWGQIAEMTWDEIGAIEMSDGRTLNDALGLNDPDRLHALRNGHATVGDGIGPLNPEWLWRALTPTLQTIAFLHCRNVETAAFDAPPKVQSKRRKKGQRPLVRYHTLRLEVPRRQSDSTGRGRYDIGSPALHIVAGHFAHYGACCRDHEPHGRLFGRLEGVYWVPTHARGDAQRGVVRTDFDIVAPGDDQ